MNALPAKHGKPEVAGALHPGPDHTIRRPSLLWTFSESMRFGMELGILGATSPMLLSAPRGDGHPVMVLPGFATSDRMTTLLRSYLALLGYKVFKWELGYNLDQKTAGERGERVVERIEEIYAKTGQRISLVGWSLGGIIAREVTRRDPSRVRQVITLGSPFTGNPHANAISKLYDRATGNDVASPATRLRFALGHHPLEVPSSAIYSRSDGIAAWRNCISETDDITENIEVHSSHFGFVANPAVFYAVADRLGQFEGRWAPFNRAGPYSTFYP
jgi:pimeloyl-ACP methyl ester carboxylesterase